MQNSRGSNGSGIQQYAGGYKGESAQSFRGVSGSAAPGSDWAVPANFEPPPTLNKRDLSHLGLDGLPTSQPSPRPSPRQSQHQGKHERVPSGGVASSQPQRTSSRPRSTAQRDLPAQHPMHAATPEISPKRASSSRQHQQQPQFGMHTVTPDASPRRSNRSMQHVSPDLSPRVTSRGERYSTPEASPQPSPRPSMYTQPPVAAPAASRNPYYAASNKLMANPAPQFAADFVEESAGLNSFGRPRGPGDPVTPRGRFSERYN